MLANSLYITFHGIGEPILSIEKEEEKYFVSENLFDEIILSLEDFEKKLGIEINITFDDGNISDLLYGVPALVKAGRRATFFVLAGRIGEVGYLSKSDLRTMVGAGMTIGSHGHDHVDWRVLNVSQRQREFVDARQKIADIIERSVDEVAIPFGRFDRDVLVHLKALNYGRVYTSSRGTTTNDTWFCPRTSIVNDFSPQRDIPDLCSLNARLKGRLLRHARKLRYGH